MTNPNESSGNSQEDLMPKINNKRSSNDSISKEEHYISAIKDPRWVNNKGEEVEEVFGFNENAELVNGRTAMFGFGMLLITELAFRGAPVTRAIFGIS